jgi:hypothetical protein
MPKPVNGVRENSMPDLAALPISPRRAALHRSFGQGLENDAIPRSTTHPRLFAYVPSHSQA